MASVQAAFAIVEMVSADLVAQHSQLHLHHRRNVAALAVQLVLDQAAFAVVNWFGLLDLDQVLRCALELDAVVASIAFDSVALDCERLFAVDVDRAVDLHLVEWRLVDAVEDFVFVAISPSIRHVEWDRVFANARVFAHPNESVVVVEPVDCRLAIGVELHE